MKIIFQVIVPPIFAIVGLVLMKQTSTTADVAVVKNLQLLPSIYLAQDGPVAKGNTAVLFQNNTPIGDILSVTDALKLKYSVVKAIGTAKPTHDCGYEILKFSSVDGKVS